MRACECPNATRTATNPIPRSNQLVRDLDTIDERARATTQTVPLDVLDAIDRGRNPEHTTLQVLYVGFGGG